jgi:plasmid replication initiation protein
MENKKAISSKAEKYDLGLDRAPGERWISMSNALTRAGHGLTLSEKRIVAIAASTLDSRRVLKPNESPRTRITAAEYAETFEVDVDVAYEQLQVGAANLYSRSITFYEQAWKRDGKPLPPTKRQMRWVGEAKYQKGEGWVELAWWPDLMRHLVGLKSYFTSYQLKQAVALKSMYSWRLMELLLRFKDTGWAEYTIEDFCVSMNATQKQSADFGKIRTKIIEPAVKELLAKNGMKIDWKPIKAGRKVKSLRFEFSQSPQADMFRGAE